MRNFAQVTMVLLKGNIRLIFSKGSEKMFFEEKLIFIICFIAVALFVVFMIFDNVRLTIKNAYLRKENSELKCQIADMEIFHPKAEERLRPYFDDAKGCTVDPQANARKNREALDRIASAMSILSQKSINK